MKPHKRGEPWTPEQKAEVLAYAQAHGHAATMRRFRISSAQIWYWNNPSKRPGYIAKSESKLKSKPNGSVKDAIIYLQHAEREILKDGKRKLSNTELLTMLALRTLSGSI